jgi:hypothetical protein
MGFVLEVLSARAAAAALRRPIQLRAVGTTARPVGEVLQGRLAHRTWNDPRPLSNVWSVITIGAAAHTRAG